MRLKKIIVFFVIIALLLIPVSSFAMTYDEFFNTYDYEYQYMIKYSDGKTNYISCRNPVNFDMSIYNANGDELVSGNSLVLSSSGVIYILNSKGNAYSHISGSLFITQDPAYTIGFSYVDVYERIGSSFFYRSP